jgi:hypothetical protein
MVINQPIPSIIELTDYYRLGFYEAQINNTNNSSRTLTLGLDTQRLREGEQNRELEGEREGQQERGRARER